MNESKDTRTPKNATAITRRGFVKGAAFASALVATGTAAGCAPNSSGTEAESTQPKTPSEQVFLNSCHGNCGRNCAWDVTVREGYIVNAEPHSYEDDPEELYRGGCMRGYLNVQRVYDADRLKYPMKRVNSKDEEEPEWEQITWEEAIDLIAEKWQGIIDEVGPTGFGFWHVYGSSAYMSGNGGGTWMRLQTAMGANMIATGADMATIWTMSLDSAVAASSFDSLRVAENFVFWGTNAAETKWPAWRFASDAREDHGAKFYNIDPQSTVTALRSDKHIPIKPATDAALAMSLMQVIFENGWEDTEFIQNRTCAPYLVKDDGTCLRESDLGIEIAKDATPQIYVWDTATDSAIPISKAKNPATLAVTGTFEVEGITVRTALDLLKERVSPYTPERCEEITGIPVDTTRELAEVIGTTHTCICKDNGHAHYKNSALTAFALDALVMISGNIGKPGSNIFYWYASGPTNVEWMATGTPGVTIPDNMVDHVIETGMLGDNPVPLKGIITYAGNVLGSAADRGQFEKALRSLDFVAVAEIRMTDTCKVADLILPVSHWWERDDIINAGLNNPYFRIAEKAVEPPFECISDYELTRRIAEKMGVAKYFQGTDQDQLAEALDSEANKAISCTYADLQEKKAIRIDEDGSIDPADGSFNTENGRVNFFLDRPTPARDYGQKLDPKQFNLPDFVDDAEVLESSPLKEAYPLVFLTPHTKYGTQTTFHHAPWLHEIIQEPEAHINPIDAQERGVVDGGYLRFFNDRGEVVVKAKFDGGMMPGIVILYHGWAKQYFKKGHYQYLSSSTNSDPFTFNQSYFDVRVQAEAYKEA